MRFASDNAGPVHPAAMAALAAANVGWARPYGDEDLTRRAADRIRELFEAPEAAVHFVATGTAANALLLSTFARPFDTIFCTAEAHIHEDECNSPEFYTGGAKLTLVESRDAKMLPEALERNIARLGSVHGPQPGPVSITSVTERGTLYTPDDIRGISDVARANGLAVHLDGARFANACAALGATAAEMSWKAGVDAVSFGGTKNGLMGVEAAVLFDPAKAREFELRRKRGGHLFSKHRYLAAQMDAYATGGLWLDLASAANTAARDLARALREVEGVSFLFEPEANMLFPRFARAAHLRLHAAGAVYNLWDGPLEGDPGEPVAARLVCDWSTPQSHIEDFVTLVRG